MEEKSSKLIYAVIEQIRDDIDDNDFTAIYELLWAVDKDKLIAFLPEEEWDKFKDK